MALRGEAVQVLSIVEHKLELNEEGLQSILKQPSIQNMVVSVITVAGAFRKGKSFILNLMLRYLSSRDKHNWLDSERGPLRGFQSMKGSERVTAGIWMWSEPFIVQLPDGTDLALLLMDTQGTCDSYSTVKDWSGIFALSTMLSSVLIYNVQNLIQEDYLQSLQLFTDYAKLGRVGRGNRSAPFQSLIFLVRDWFNKHEYEYGEEGGDKYLKKIINQSTHTHEDNAKLREDIAASFQQKRCFLMPFPGKKVAGNDNLVASDIDEDFIEEVEKLFQTILSPTNLLAKTINAAPVKGRELLTYFQQYVETFKSDKMPTPKTVYEATAEANNCIAFENACDYYRNEMTKRCRNHLDDEAFERIARAVYTEALRGFEKTKKMGGNNLSVKYRKHLTDALPKIADKYRELNKANDPFATLKAGLAGAGLTIGALAAGVGAIIAARFGIRPF